MSKAATTAAANAGIEANKYLKPEERIPGWSETASGTLLDSYWEPEPQLDAKAKEKAPDVPGWSNTASGTLTDSYVTPKEAQAKLDAEKARLEQKVADEQAALAQRVATGELTPDASRWSALNFHKGRYLDYRSGSGRSGCRSALIRYLPGYDDTSSARR